MSKWIYVHRSMVQDSKYAARTDTGMRDAMIQSQVAKSFIWSLLSILRP